MPQQESHFFEPAWDDIGLPHSPLNAIIAPRPIGWISTRSAEGVLNLAPFSFFNAFNYVPPIVGYACTTPADSLTNAEATGTFCWNLVTRDLAESMNSSAAAVPPDVDEFGLAGLHPATSRVVDAPHVAEAKVVFECRTSQVLRLQSASGEPTGTHMVFGEVVGVHINRDLLADGIYQTALAEPVLRGGGPTTYYTISEELRFDVERPSPTHRPRPGTDS